MCLLIPALSLTACAQKKVSYQSPAGYEFSDPIRYAMNDDLLEISGITFENGRSDTVYAEQDEEGKVYYLRLGDKKAKDVKFGKKGDYEDIAICNGYVIVLRSDGALYCFSLEEVKKGQIQDTRKWNDLLPKGEYESLYADPETNQLVLLCKDSHEDHKTGRVSGYRFQLKKDGTILPAGSFVFHPEQIKQKTGKDPGEFKPSALTRDNRTGNWYILSSVNKMLVVTGKHWKVEHVYKLDPSLFVQPEGIAFDNAHALYISNEGDKTTAGTILKFPYKEPGRASAQDVPPVNANGS